MLDRISAPVSKFYLSFLVCFLLIQSLNAQNLVLDNSFGENGIAIHDLGLSVEQTNGIAKTSDNKYVIAVNNYSLGYLMKYKSDGALDSTFGTNGIVSYSYFEMQFVGIAVDTANNILVAGTVGESYSFLLKYSEDGTLYSNFGVNGTLGLGIIAHNLIVQPDGKYLVVGRNESEYKAAIQRINPDGSPDNTFDDDGQMTMIHTAEFLNATLDDQNNIVATGDVVGQLFVARILPNGKRDSTFSLDGFVTFQQNNDDFAGYSICIRPNGKIAIAGSINEINQQPQWGIWQYTPDGIMDTSFGQSGSVDSLWPMNGYGNANSIISFDDTALLIGGAYFDGYSYQQILVKLKTNGSLDSSYGTNGIARLELDGIASVYLKKLSNDSVLLCTSRFNQHDFIPCLTKLDPSGNVDHSFGMNGIAGAKAGTFNSYDGISSIVSLSNGKILAVDNFISGISNKAPVVRYNSDGTIDSTYGTNGLLFLDKTLDLANNGLFRQRDSIIYCIMPGGDGSSKDSLWFNIYKFKADGTVDSLYGNEGTGRFSPRVTGHIITSFTGAIIQEDGKFVFMGSTDWPGYDIYLFRLLANGNIDSSFGIGGYFQFSIFDADRPYGFVQQSDGKYVLISNNFYGTNNDPWVVTRIDSDGSALDSSFGVNGSFQFLETLIDPTHIFESPILFVCPDKKILITETNGYYTTGYGSIRLTADGMLDSSFHSDGSYFNPDYTDGMDFYRMLPSGRVIAGGSTDSKLLLMRLNTDLTVDSSFGTDGREIFDPPGFLEYGPAMFLFPDSSVYLAGSVGDYGAGDELLMHFIYQGIPLGEPSITNVQNSIMVYPNPSGDFLIIHYTGNGLVKNGNLEILDGEGKTVLQQGVEFLTSDQNIFLDIHNLSTGSYWLNFTSSNQCATTQFIKD